MTSEKELNLKNALEYGDAFKFSGGEISTNRRAYEDFYGSIFTYDSAFKSELPGLNPLEEQMESGIDPYHRKTSRIKKSSAFDGILFVILCGLSAITLLVLLPFIGWIFIKRLKDKQRMVVFRLGHRTKTKGPGWIVLLPFVDKFHLVKLDPQTVEIKNVSNIELPYFTQGGTLDKAVMELDWCKIHFRVLEPDLLVVKASKKPKLLVRAKAETTILNAMNKVEAANLASGCIGRFEVTSETKMTLNAYCMQFGVQISDIDLGEFAMVAEPPPKKSILDKLGSTMNAMAPGLPVGLGSVFVGGEEGNQKDVLADAYNLDGTPARNLNPDTKTAFNAFIQQLASMAQQPSNRDYRDSPSSCASTSSTIATSSSANGVVTTNGHAPLNVATVYTNGSATAEPSTSAEKPASVDQKAILILLSAVVARATPLLRSEAACRALGRTSLQLLLIEDGEPVALDHPNCDGQAAAYMDASTGEAGIGKLKQKPSVEIQLCKEDLRDALAGRLDMVDAITRNRARMKGDLFALSKLRHLIQLQPSSQSR
ncbi:hypothetical protein Ciccas_006722 [Cichlidogyrus casuarinus]|uniref:Band 7 domain-containing protein n=1 Tax=Cichlidogyrus casuarinus TaxID=1844966 RepID=A0ABD2Q4Z6_9PLAT